MSDIISASFICVELMIIIVNYLDKVVVVVAVIVFIDRLHF